MAIAEVLQSESFSTAEPTKEEALLAKQAREKLSRIHRPNRNLRVVADGTDPVEIPAPAAELLARILNAMASGEALTLIPFHAELTTQQAADTLGVSRPFIVKQIEEGKLPCRKVGAHRRVRFDDLMAFKQRIDMARQKTLDELTEESQRLGIGY